MSKFYDEMTSRACLAASLAYFEGVDAQTFSDPVCDAQATMAVRTARTGLKEAVVAFRGSSSALDWVHNLIVPMRHVPTLPRNARAHSGFLCQYLSIHSDLAAAIQDADVDRVVFCGHSLGGALAAIAAAMLSLPPDVAKCLVTFGAPRPGNAGLAALVTKACSVCTRVVHDRDIVPTMPLRCTGYAHVTSDWLCLNGDGELHVRANERSLMEELWLRVRGSLSLDFGVADHLMDRYMRAIDLDRRPSKVESDPGPENEEAEQAPAEETPEDNDASQKPDTQADDPEPDAQEGDGDAPQEDGKPEDQEPETEPEEAEEESESAPAEEGDSEQTPANEQSEKPDTQADDPEPDTHETHEEGDDNAPQEDGEPETEPEKAEEAQEGEAEQTPQNDQSGDASQKPESDPDPETQEEEKPADQGESDPDPNQTNDESEAGREDAESGETTQRSAQRRPATRRATTNPKQTKRSITASQ